MRLYTFTNYYLSSLQVGLQTAHVVHELFNKYVTDDIPHTEQNMLWDWSDNHKTIVILNGGNCATLGDLELFLQSRENEFAYSAFCEDRQSLNNALTCVGIVLPERIYDAAAEVRSGTMTFVDDPMNGGYLLEKDAAFRGRLAPRFTTFEKELIDRLNRCGLAK